MNPKTTSESSKQPPVCTQSNPILFLRLYHRLLKDRKQLFATSDNAPATHFIRTEYADKGHTAWRPVFYRGDNPKYSPDSTAIGRMRRSRGWKVVRIWLGDGVQDLIQEEEEERRLKKGRVVISDDRDRMARKIERGEGKVILIQMEREGGSIGVDGSYGWELGGVKYRWRGTGALAVGRMKLVRVKDGAVIAAFDKENWGGSVKDNDGPNKRKKHYGTLKIYDRGMLELGEGETETPLTKAIITGVGGLPEIDEMELNPGGTHSGNILEDAIVMTAWVAVEAGHRLRHKPVDFVDGLLDKSVGYSEGYHLQ